MKETFLQSLAMQPRADYMDFDVHPETLNFAPYNPTFMATNQKQYLDIRKTLRMRAKSNKKLQDPQIEAAVAPLGIKL